ncbi:glycosyltransferase family 2 protein [Flavobacteriaceae bacterium]|jgi:dolichol-phosphate mannosyltransferase|nr:glycosyltransferase family 2 protein [Flavobacteriaceae bacterium]|tara:strand:+ start:212 stop:934 length:723 start_codon:yes stop_codon:yes gene_type:complete
MIKKMLEFTIIVPVYNEELNLKRVEKELLSFIKIAKKKTTILFINDGSTDNSQQIIEDICQKNIEFRFIHFKNNKGLSAALKAGFDNIDTPLLGYIDADLQTSPKDFNILLNHTEHYDLVTGIRTQRKDSLIKKISSKISNKIRTIFTNDGMDDSCCPLKIIKTDCAKKIPMFKGLHRFLPAMVLLQKGTVLQIPIQHFPRIAGKTKFGIRNRLLGPITDCFAYLWMKKKYINYEVIKKK